MIKSQPAQRVRGILSYTVRCENLQAREWLIAAAQLPELPGQSKVSSMLQPQSKRTTELGVRARPVLVGRVPARTAALRTAIPIRITYEATLHSRRLVPAVPGASVPKAPELDPRERQAALGSADPFDYRSPQFRGWILSSGLLRKEGEPDIELARRVFTLIRKEFRWDGSPKAPLRASTLSGTKRGDCGGLAIVFVSAMRFNGVPARTLWGRWATTAEPGATLAGKPFRQTHVKAEFFVHGLGWVPSDLSSAILHDRSPDGLMYFGNDLGDFITFHVDQTFELETHAFGRQSVPNLQNPAWWVVGEGSVLNPKVEEIWRVKEID
jgi:hypothetical protein